MAITAQIISDDRGSERFAVGLNATLRDTVTRPHDVVIEDLSMTGFRLSGGPPLDIGAQASVGFAGIGIHQARVMRQEGQGYGCEFVTPITPEMLSTALTAAPAAPIAFPASTIQAGWSDAADPAPEPYVEPFSPRTKLTVAVIAAAAGWAAALGLYLTLA